MGEIVLVKSPSKKIQHWLLGRVLELIPSSDNKIRSARVKRGDEQVQVHSLKHLYPMELSLTHLHIVKDSGTNNAQNVPNGDVNLVGQLQTDPNFEDPELIGSQDPEPDNVDTGSVLSSVVDNQVIDHNLNSHLDNSNPVSVLSSVVDNQVTDHNLNSSLDLADPVSDFTDLVGNQVIDQNLSSSTTDLVGELHVQPGVNLNANSRRPRRIASSRGRPLDGDYLWY